MDRCSGLSESSQKSSLVSEIPPVARALLIAYCRRSELEISLFLLRRLLGVKTEDKKQTRVTKLLKGELLLINIGSTSTGGRVLSVKADLAKIQLTSPACTEIGEKVALSRRIEKHWRLVGEDFALSSMNGAYPGLKVGEVFNGEQYWRLTRLRIDLYFWCREFCIPLLFLQHHREPELLARL